MFNLMEELLRYQPYNKDEEKCLREIIQFLNTSENCFDRSNLLGHITAGGFVCDNQGNILLNHHKKTGMWFQFGGHSDANSNSLEVAKREIYEEAGITELQLISNKIFDVDIHKIAYSIKRNEPEHLHYDINFLFYVNNHDFKLSDESTEIKWVSIDEVRNLIDKEDNGTNRMIDKYEKILKIKF